jgi:hypothetical protein
MTDENGLPSAADLDAVNAELEAEAKTHAPSEHAQDAAVSEGTKAEPVKPVLVSRDGVIFNPEIHAAHADGTPKTDSRGVYIEKVHDYNPRTPNIPGGK